MSNSGSLIRIITAAEVNAEVDTALNTAIPGSPTVDSINDVLKNIDTGMLVSPGQCLASDDLLFSNDAEITGSNTSYILKKNTVSGVSGTLRVKFDLRGTSGSATAIAKIYKNGVAFGTERECIINTYSTFSEDLEFTFGDTIEVWFKATTPNAYAGQNFRIYGVIYTKFTNLVT